MMFWSWNGWHGLIPFAWIIIQVQCQFSDNTPPTIWLDRTWQILNTEPIGSKIAQVHGRDNEGAQLQYGLEPLSLPLNTKEPVQVLPFIIDSNTGTVYLNESLKDRAGENIRLYVTASDGQVTAKAEVYVNILNATSNLPTFPGQQNILRSSGFLVNFKPHSQPPPHPPFYKPKPLTTNNTTTHLKPINAENKDDFTTSTPSTTTNKIIKNEQENFENNTIHNNEEVKSGTDVAITVVPIALVCTIFLVFAIFAFLVRKKVQGSKLADAEDDIRKTSTGVLSQQDSGVDNPVWRRFGPFNNQYEPWQNENSLQARYQLSSSTEKADHWEFPRHRLKFFNILGEGAFGQVWKCEAVDINGNEGVATVAVKTLKENANEKEKLDLISEVQVMKMLKPHPNVVRLLGCCTEKEPIFLIMEYITEGKLQSYLRNSRAERYYNNMHGPSKSLTSRDLTSFVYQVAKGMEFLTSHGIIHRDLAARNILITEEHTCKVADFGFARDIIASHVYEKKSEGRLPIRWMAPESLYDNIFSVKSDVWSFGILIWEVVTLGSTPYPGLSAAEVMKQVRSGYRLEKPEHCRREIYNIMYYCWDKDPAERPSFSECVKLLENLLMTETDYIQLERFPDHSYYNMISLSGEKL